MKATPFSLLLRIRDEAVLAGPFFKVDLQRSNFADADWSVAIQALQCLQEPRANLYGLLCCVWINIKAM
jgi:hypothetical protein